MSLRSYPSILAGVALATAMTDTTTAPGAAALSTVAEFEFPNLEGKRSFDCATIPGNVRLDFLFGAVRAYIANRLNGVHTRHLKDEAVAAWIAYDEAVKADPLQSVVPKPEGERPGEPDYEDAYNRAVADLVAGNIRRQSAEPKARKTKDPLVSVVSEVVAREVFESRRAADPKYSYLKAKAEVGDGIAYLNKLIDAKVEAGAPRADLEKMRDTKYINPAKAMLGISTTKAVSELPSIL
jgi:hypothetical protein